MGGVKVALLSAVAASTLGYVGYRVFFNRTGEAAVGLIPADASCVITLDTHPSENQLGAFTMLSNALKGNGLDHDMEDGISSIIGKAGIAKDVRQYLTSNLASAWWAAKPGSPTVGIVLLSIRDAGAVSQLISSGSPVNGAGVPAYSFGSNGAGAVAAVVGDYLAIAQDPAVIARVVSCQHGAASVANMPEYQSARAALPADANLMVFASPASLNGLMGKGAEPTTMWVAFGAALRDGGIQFDYRGPVDAKHFPGMAELSNMKPLDMGILKKLPPDAYGLLAQSSLDKYLGAMASSVGQVAGKDTVDKGKADFEKETELSIDNDILPAFKGDVVLAVYPDVTQSVKSADGVLLIDNANGANPAALADKVRAFIERRTAAEAAKSGQAPLHFIQNQRGQATVWSLDEASAVQMRKSMGVNTAGPNGAALPNPAFADKNVSYAVQGGSVVVATSPVMMNKALDSLNGGRSLADDYAFGSMEARVDPKDQCVVMCSLSRIAERFSTELIGATKDSDFTPDDVINLFGGRNAGLVGSYHVTGNTATGSMFIPLDFERMAKLITSEKRRSHRSPISDGTTEVLTK